MTLKVTTHAENRTVVLHLETADVRLTYTSFRQLLNGGLLEAIMTVAGTPIDILRLLTHTVEYQPTLGDEHVGGDNSPEFTQERNVHLG